jgi:Zn-dependent protease
MSDQPTSLLPPPPPPLPHARAEMATSPKKHWLKRLFAPFAFVLVLLSKFKALLIPLVKFFPVFLKTGGTMFLAIWAYSMLWGWKFAAGMVLLIFVHECGHLLAARYWGLKVGAPVFIPFMGAFIALKEAPRNAWIEAQIGIGGPMLGTLGSAVCFGIYLLTDQPMFAGLAYVGFLLNLFNLAPTGFLDGGRIVTALSPWLWVVGMVVVAVMLCGHPTNFILWMILFFSLPRLFSLFRKKTDEERRFFEVTPEQRWLMGALYFGLIIFLVIGMAMTMRAAQVR